MLYKVKLNTTINLFLLVPITNLHPYYKVNLKYQNQINFIIKTIIYFLIKILLYLLL